MPEARGDSMRGVGLCTDLYEIRRAEAPIDAYGVGTAMGVSADAPSLDTAFKLVAYEGQPVMKLSSGKVTAPGAKQVYRSRSCSTVAALVPTTRSRARTQGSSTTWRDFPGERVLSGLPRHRSRRGAPRSAG